MNTLLSDLRFTLRSLRRQPVFTSVAVLVLALGIGANTAVFSVVNAVLLRPLPYPQPDRLVFLRETAPLFDEGSVSLPNYLDWRGAQRGFTDLGIVRRNTFNFAFVPDGGTPLEPERVNGAEMSANYLSILGSRQVLGRVTASDDTPAAPRVVLISDRLWRRRFNADRAVVGRSVMPDNVRYEAIGVLDPTLAHPRLVDLWVPLAEVRKDPLALNRDNHPGFSVIGRLCEGVTLAAAAAQINEVARELERRYPATNANRHVNVRRLLDATVGDYRLDPSLPLSDIATINESISSRMVSDWLTMVLLGAFAALALVLASVGLYGVMNLGVTQRTRELGIRLALGAQRGNVLGLVLRDGFALVGVGLLVGLLAAWALGGLLSKMLYGVRGSDPMILAGVSAVLAGTALIACWLPARRATRVDPLVALREE